jgi:hypothetical protein
VNALEAYHIVHFCGSLSACLIMILISRTVIYFSEIFGFVSTELTSKHNSPTIFCLSFLVSNKPRDLTPDTGHSACNEHLTVVARFNSRDL